MRKRSLSICLFALLVISLGMDCTAMNEAPVDRGSVGAASMNTATVGTVSVGSSSGETSSAVTEEVNNEWMNSSSYERSEHIENILMIGLEGCEQIQLPGMEPVQQEGLTSQEPLSEVLAVYNRGMPIQGGIELSRERDDFATDSGSGIDVCISPLSLKGYLAKDPGKSKLSGETICTKAVISKGRGNDSAAKKAHLTFGIPQDRMAEKRSGLYALYALDRNRSLIAPAQAFFLTEGEAVLQMEDRIPSENSSIKINLSSGSEEERTRLFAAAIMPRKEYDNASIRLVANESNPWPVLALSSGSRYLEIVANPATARKQLMDMVSLLPEDSAVSMQESARSAVDLVLLADGPWKKGEYVIVCAIYSPGVGLEGLKQKIVKVI